MNGRRVIVFILCALAVWVAGLDGASASPVARAPVSESTHGPMHTAMHTVQWGDTLWGISIRYGTTVQAMLRANGLHSDRIYAGQRLVIPRGSWHSPVPDLPGGRIYTVRWGDTLWSIAQRHGTTVSAIMLANGLRSYRIYAGQRLRVLMSSPPPIPTPVPRLPEVFLSPWSGPPGTVVTVRAVGFPAWDVVQVGVGPYGSEFSPVASVRTDEAGTAVARVRADAAAGVNLVIAARTSGAGWALATYASGLFRVR